MYIKAFIIATMCVIGFSFIFNLPRRVLLHSGIAGAFGWVAYTYFLNTFSSTIAAALIGALVVGLLGEILARIMKMPATTFVIPGIIPLVPGYGLYYSMLKIIERNYQQALNVGFESLLIALGIAAGVIISTSMGKLINRRRKVIPQTDRH
ncbi:threonine/serine exporter family protein [Vallitaleaceae bacterium 9-2]